MQQEEIARLRKNTKKIREKAASHHAGQSEDREEEVKREQPKVSGAGNDIRKKNSNDHDNNSRHFGVSLVV